MPKIPYSKRPDGRYYKQIVIGFDSKGKRKVKTLYDRDWRKLDKKVKEFYLNAEHGVFINEDITLGECAEYVQQKPRKQADYFILKNI